MITEVHKARRGRNGLTALAIMGCVGGVYALTLYKMSANPLDDKNVVAQFEERKAAKEKELEQVKQESIKKLEEK
jgi:hypothetical protein